MPEEYRVFEFYEVEIRRDPNNKDYYILEIEALNEQDTEAFLTFYIKSERLNELFQKIREALNG